jgi:hypothetical protein
MEVDLYNSAVLCYHLRRQRVSFEPYVVLHRFQRPASVESSFRTMNYVNSIILWSVGEPPILM